MGALVVHWNIDPAIFRIGGFELRWYSLLFVAGFVLGWFIFQGFFRREKISEKLLDPLLYTLLICTMTGLVILSTGADGGVGGIRGVMDAFAAGLPLPETVSRGMVVGILALFAFTTVVGWSFYGVRCLGFLTGENRKAKRVYLTVYAATVLLAPYLPVQSLWMAANICNGLMAVPNLIAILLLNAQVRLDARDIIRIYREAREGRKRHGNRLSGRPGSDLRKAGRRALHR